MLFDGFKFEKVGNNLNDFYAKSLPFELTKDQKKVIKEIRNDFRDGKQMNRLLQGDVGSHLLELKKSLNQSKKERLGSLKYSMYAKLVLVVYSSILSVDPFSYQGILFKLVEDSGKIMHPVVRKLLTVHIIPKNIVGSWR